MMCAADFVYYRTSWFITFPTVVGGSEQMHVRLRTWHRGYSWEERMGGRLEERRERGRGRSSTPVPAAGRGAGRGAGIWELVVEWEGGAGSSVGLGVERTTVG